MGDLPIGAARFRHGTDKAGADQQQTAGSEFGQALKTKQQQKGKIAQRMLHAWRENNRGVSAGAGDIGKGPGVSTLPPVPRYNPNPASPAASGPTIPVQQLLQNPSGPGNVAAPQPQPQPQPKAETQTQQPQPQAPELPADPKTPTEPRPLVDNVSVYGRFNFGGLYFNNGAESGFRAVNNDTFPTTLRVVAERQLPNDLTLQGRVELWVVGGSFGSNAVTPEGYGTGLPVFPAAAEVTLSHPNFGTLSAGQGSTATDFAVQLAPNLGPIITIGNNMPIDGTVGPEGEPLTLREVANDLDGARAPRIRYDTPSWQGFTLSGSAMTEDSLEAALRYSGNWGSLGVKTAFGYTHAEPGDRLVASAVISDEKSGAYMSGAISGQIIDGAADPSLKYFQAGVQGDKVSVHAWHGEYDNFAGSSNASRSGGMIEYKPVKGLSFYIEGDYWRVTDAQDNRGSLITVLPGMKLEFGK